MDGKRQLNLGHFVRQIQLEQEMRSIGTAREQMRTEKAVAGERESETSYGGYILRQVIEPLALAIRDFTITEASKSGEANRAADYLSLVTPEEAAFIIARTTLDSLTQNKMEQTVAVDIGRRLEEELRLRAYHASLPALFDTIVRDHKERGISPKHTKRVIQNRLKKAGVEWNEWPEVDCLHVGMKGIMLFAACEFPEIGPIIERVEMKVRTARKHKASVRVAFAPGALKLVETRRELSALLTPGFLPTVIPPAPWSTPFRGAYHTEWVNPRSRRLVKTRNMNYLKDLRATVMPDVYRAVNIVQATSWKINRKVYEVLGKLWDEGSEAAGLPPRENRPLPTQPAEVPPCKYSENRERYIEWAKTEAGQRWRNWRYQANQVHEFNTKIGSRRFQIGKALWVAKMFLNDKAIYFPHQLDFRSRVYCMPMYLHPQGPDPVRGMLTFAEGHPINTPVAKHWLMVHGANSFGIDKVSFHERVDWVKKNEGHILSCAADPFEDRFWCEAENPWQFLAFCFEWAGFVEHGYGFVSSLPVSLDGTCNGLQHFSAMLRDQVGGSAVNLVPASKPQDIYERVAERVRGRLIESRDSMADAWLSFGVDRKLTKRPVMILPYGGTQHTCRKYVAEYVSECLMDGSKPNPFGDNQQEAVAYISTVLWHSIGDVVIAARDAMKWLRAVAKIMCDAELPIQWVTPVGFPVRQAYPELEHRQVTLTLEPGVTYRKWITTETDGLARDEQINGLSPNFVHSLDASALMACVLAAREQGITSFAMVHDSYGTTAAQTETLCHALRRAFVDLYRKHNVLAELQECVVQAIKTEEGIPILPAEGVLDIERVLESKFFFA